jgi:protein-disulfide isomerase
MARQRYRLLGALAACLLSTTVTAQPSAATQARDLANLKEDVQQLKTQQQQILASLDELKKLLRARNELPAVKVPDTMSVAGEPFRGEAGASLAIIEYADFECPFCRRFEHDTFPQIQDAYIGTGKVKYFYRDLPLPFHQHSMPAARAARCAAEQGKLWEMHDSLFSDPASLNTDDMDARAAKLGIDTTKLDACMASERFADVIQRSMNEASGMQISGTPTFVIGTLGANGELVNVKKTIVGAFPFEAFKAVIDPLLAAPQTPLASANQKAPPTGSPN